VHVDFARDIVAACEAAGVRRYVHMSAQNAAPDAPSKYLRSKGEAEAIVAASSLAWTVFRPNVVFGRGDRLTSMFVGLAGFGMPLPLGGANAELAPVWVEDVAWCIARALTLDATILQRYELCGPQAMTLASLVRTTLDIAGRPRAVIPLPDGLARLLAAVLERLPGKLLTRDNLASLSVPAVCAAPFPAVFGVEPTPFAALAPSWLGPGAARSEYDVFRARVGRVYEVGGAVRDALLGRAIADRDFVVVGATPEMMMASGYRPVGNDFPVFLHPDTHEEHALARTERKHGTGYRGFEFFASPDVTLEEDLARRDLTINAMARDESGTIIDPFNGRDDLARGILRHVSPAFAEDPLRVLRVARFAARFGFRVAPATRALMKRIAASGELATISPERVWRELAIGLAEATPSRMIEVLRGCDALAPLLPEVDALFGVPAVDDALARPRGAAKDAGLRMLQALDRTAADRGDLSVRYATMVQTLGAAASATAIMSGALARASARRADALSARLKAP